MAEKGNPSLAQRKTWRGRFALTVALTIAIIALAVVTLFQTSKTAETPGNVPPVPIDGKTRFQSDAQGNVIAVMARGEIVRVGDSYAHLVSALGQPKVARWPDLTAMPWVVYV